MTSKAPTGEDSPFSNSVGRSAYFVFFIAVAATAFGASYYHLRPNDRTLVWDRLPMAVGSLSLLTAVVLRAHDAESRIVIPRGASDGGVGSVFYWRATRESGRGDLRP
jgi:hypothetical protein